MELPSGDQTQIVTSERPVFAVICRERLDDIAVYREQLHIVGVGCMSYLSIEGGHM